MWARFAPLSDGEWRFDGGITVKGPDEARFNRLVKVRSFSPVLWNGAFPDVSACLWSEVKGTRGLDLLRKFPAPPSVIVRKGASAVAVWSVWPELPIPHTVEFNERLARFFGGKVRSAQPHSFRLDLTEGEVFLLNNLHDANHVAGRL